MTIVERLTAALPARTDLDGPVGVDSHDLRVLLGSLVNVNAMGDTEDRYVLGEMEGE